MGLSCANINLLLWTRRKADCEFRISIASMDKMIFARQSADLTRLYNQKRSAKEICYYDHGKYNKVNYAYLMGNTFYTGLVDDSTPFKKNPNMVLCDYSGRVVMSDDYARYMRQVLGESCIDNLGNGSTFDQSYIPKIIAAITGCSEEQIANGIDNYEVNSHSQTTTNQTSTGSGTLDITDQMNAQIQQYVDIYFPIFQAAAANGWTTKYNNDMAVDSDYISNQLISGNFQLFEVNYFGQYEPDKGLNFFITNGSVDSQPDYDKLEDVEAWYTAEKENIKFKEDMVDLEIKDISAELEAAKTMLESLKKQVTDNISRTFNWGSGN